MQVGDYELGSSLQDILTCLPTIINDNGNRQNSYLFNLPTQELFDRFDNAMYGAENLQYAHIAI